MDDGRDLLDSYLDLFIFDDSNAAAVLKELQKVGFDLKKSKTLNETLEYLVGKGQNLEVLFELDLVPAFDAARHSDVIVSYFEGMIEAQRRGENPGGISWNHVDRLLQMGYVCVNQKNFT